MVYHLFERIFGHYGEPNKWFYTNEAVKEFVIEF